MANANNGQTISSNDTYLFRSENAGGSDINNAHAISVYNGDSAETLLARCDWYGASEYVPIPPGKSFTFEERQPGVSIGFVIAKRAGSTDVTSVGWGVSARGHGESKRT